MKKTLLFAILALSINAFAQATIIPGGNVSGTWTLAGSPYLIQGSIQIPNDSTLTIEPGVEVIFQGTYKLYVQGRVIAIGTATDTITFTATDTTNGWRGIRFDNTPTTNDTSKLMYCKLQYGKATGALPDDKGGAFYFYHFSKVIISNCRISDCTANSNGGGIYCYNQSSPTIINNTISNNSASDGGGIWCFDSSPTISNNTISNNSASNGGGIFCQDSWPTISNNIISNNSANFDGGGIWCFSSLIITNNTISNNSASDGGGIFCFENSNPTISNNTISNNSANNYGGGILCWLSSSTITNNTISNNSAFNGGGICCYYGGIPTISNNTISNNSASYGGGIFCFENSNPTISNNTISNNSANNYGGGILCCLSSSTITNNTISNNSAFNGGGIYCVQSTPTITNNTISNNTADYSGGGIYCTENSNPTLRNTILWGNTASGSGQQVYLNDETSDPNFYYCDVQGGTAAFGLNGVFYTGTYQNNINTDPLFVSPSAGSGTSYNGVTADWSLQSSSPCINAGDPSGTYPATDKAGNPRVVGGTIDIGAYEYQGTVSITASVSQTEFAVYPNPTSGKVAVGNSSGSINSIEIYNVLGERVLKISNFNPPAGGQNSNEIDFSEHPKGIYFVRLLTDDGEKIYLEKIVIQ